MNFELDLGKVGVTIASEPWSRDTHYERLTILKHNNVCYISRVDNQDVEPGTDSSVWMMYPGGGGSTGGAVGVKEYQGALYWYYIDTGNWVLDPDGNKVRAEGRDGINGKDGKDGKNGKDGSDGEPGPQGIPGVAGKGRNVMAFCATDSIDDRPETPVGGHIDTSTWEITYPAGWGDSNELEGFVWTSNCDFDNDGNPITHYDSEGHPYTWTVPFCITGEKGDAGADGLTTEFVYLTLESKEAFEYYFSSDECQEVINQRQYTRDGVTHRYSENDFIPYNESWENNRWQDHPEGISEEMKVEICLSRKKDANDEWAAWSGPVLWSSWGEDGMDGDGIEYIFAVTNYYEHPAMTTLPKSTDDSLEAHWQDPEIWDYIKSQSLEDRYAPWTDDPQDVSENEPYEWVSIRRRKWVAEESQSIFGEFSEPVLWAKWGKDGEKGRDGTSVSIKGSIKDYDDLPISGMEAGDGYICDVDIQTPSGDVWYAGHLIVWDGDSWKDVGVVRGPGSIVYIAYSNDKEHLTGHDGKDPGEYIGFCVGTEEEGRPTVATRYQPWMKFMGQDGFGYEYIFKPTEENEAPIIPTRSDDIDGYVPTGWYDELSDIEDSERYIWRCYRKKEDGHWGGWKGSEITHKAVLFTYKGKDGNDGIDGQPGKAVRYRGEWNSETTYSGLNDPESKFADIVFVVDSEGVTHQYLSLSENAGIKPGSSGSSEYWQPATEFKFVATDVLFAKLSYIKNLGVSVVKITDSDGNVRAGFMPENTPGEDNGDTLLWIGDDSPEDAPYKVQKDGSFYSNKGVMGNGAKIGAFDINNKGLTNLDKNPEAWMQIGVAEGSNSFVSINGKTTPLLDVCSAKGSPAIQAKSLKSNQYAASLRKHENLGESHGKALETYGDVDIRLHLGNGDNPERACIHYNSDAEYIVSSTSVVHIWTGPETLLPSQRHDDTLYIVI